MHRPTLLVATTAALTLAAGAALTGAAQGSDHSKTQDTKRPGAASQDATQLTAQDVTASGIDKVGTRSFRVWGKDRYETAVAMSQFSLWESDNTYTVYLANGTASADALSVGASDFDNGPLLFTHKDSLTPVTKAEIQRLRPCEIVVMGGTGVISAAVAAEADKLTASCTPG